MCFEEEHNDKPDESIEQMFQQIDRSKRKERKKGD